MNLNPIDESGDNREVLARKFVPGALKDRLSVPENFLDPDTEIEGLFNDGQILSGVPDEELLDQRSGPSTPNHAPLH
jgi:hypothetical protein